MENLGGRHKAAAFLSREFDVNQKIDCCRAVALPNSNADVDVHRVIEFHEFIERHVVRRSRADIYTN